MRGRSRKQGCGHHLDAVDDTIAAGAGILWPTPIESAQDMSDIEHIWATPQRSLGKQSSSSARKSKPRRALDSASPSGKRALACGSSGRMARGKETCNNPWCSRKHDGGCCNNVCEQCCLLFSIEFCPRHIRCKQSAQFAATGQVYSSAYDGYREWYEGKGLVEGDAAEVEPGLTHLNDLLEVWSIDRWMQMGIVKQRTSASRSSRRRSRVLTEAKRIKLALDRSLRAKRIASAPSSADDKRQEAERSGYPPLQRGQQGSTATTKTTDSTIQLQQTDPAVSATSTENMSQQSGRQSSNGRGMCPSPELAVVMSDGEETPAPTAAGGKVVGVPNRLSLSHLIPSRGQQQLSVDYPPTKGGASPMVGSTSGVSEASELEDETVHMSPFHAAEVMRRKRMHLLLQPGGSLGVGGTAPSGAAGGSPPETLRLARHVLCDECYTYHWRARASRRPEWLRSLEQQDGVVSSIYELVAQWRTEMEAGAEAEAGAGCVVAAAGAGSKSSIAPGANRRKTSTGSSIPILSPTQMEISGFSLPAAKLRLARTRPLVSYRDDGHAAMHGRDGDDGEDDESIPSISSNDGTSASARGSGRGSGGRPKQQRAPAGRRDGDRAPAAEGTLSNPLRNSKVTADAKGGADGIRNGISKGKMKGKGKGKLKGGGLSVKRRVARQTAARRAARAQESSGESVIDLTDGDEDNEDEEMSMAATGMTRTPSRTPGAGIDIGFRGRDAGWQSSSLVRLRAARQATRDPTGRLVAEAQRLKAGKYVYDRNWTGSRAPLFPGRVLALGPSAGGMRNQAVLSPGPSSSQVQRSRNRRKRKSPSRRLCDVLSMPDLGGGAADSDTMNNGQGEHDQASVEDVDLLEDTALIDQHTFQTRTPQFAATPVRDAAATQEVASLQASVRSRWSSGGVSLGSRGYSDDEISPATMAALAAHRQLQMMAPAPGQVLGYPQGGHAGAGSIHLFPGAAMGIRSDAQAMYFAGLQQSLSRRFAMGGIQASGNGQTAGKGTGGGGGGGGGGGTGSGQQQGGQGAANGHLGQAGRSRRVGGSGQSRSGGGSAGANGGDDTSPNNSEDEGPAPPQDDAASSDTDEENGRNNSRGAHLDESASQSLQRDASQEQHSGAPGVDGITGAASFTSKDPAMVIPPGLMIGMGSVMDTAATQAFSGSLAVVSAGQAQASDKSAPEFAVVTSQLTTDSAAESASELGQAQHQHQHQHAMHQHQHQHAAPQHQQQQHTQMYAGTASSSSQLPEYTGESYEYPSMASSKPAPQASLRVFGTDARRGLATDSLSEAHLASAATSMLAAGSAHSARASRSRGAPEHLRPRRSAQSSHSSSSSSGGSPTESVGAADRRTRGRVPLVTVGRKRSSNRRVRGDTGYLTEVITYAAQQTYGEGLQLETTTISGHFLLAFNNRVLRSKGVRPWRIAEWRAATRKLATHQIRKDRSSTEILFRCRGLLEATGNKYDVANGIVQACDGNRIRGFRSERMTEVAAELPDLAELEPKSKKRRTVTSPLSSREPDVADLAAFEGLRALAAAGAAADSSLSSPPAVSSDTLQQNQHHSRQVQQQLQYPPMQYQPQQYQPQVMGQYQQQMGYMHPPKQAASSRQWAGQGQAGQQTGGSVPTSQHGMPSAWAQPMPMPVPMSYLPVSQHQAAGRSVASQHPRGVETSQAAPSAAASASGALVTSDATSTESGRVSLHGTSETAEMTGSPMPRDAAVQPGSGNPGMQMYVVSTKHGPLQLWGQPGLTSMLQPQPGTSQSMQVSYVPQQAYGQHQAYMHPPQHMMIPAQPYAHMPQSMHWGPSMPMSVGPGMVQYGAPHQMMGPRGMQQYPPSSAEGSAQVGGTDAAAWQHTPTEPASGINTTNGNAPEITGAERGMQNQCKLGKPQR